MADNSEDEIYQEHILDHYEDPYHRGSCDGKTHADEGDNPLCGDKVSLELRIDPQGVIREAWFDGKGCIISQSCSSMLVEEIEGKSVDELKKFSADDMLRLIRVRLTPNRQKCGLLPWRVLQSAMHSPIAKLDGGAHYGGPNLGEEA